MKTNAILRILLYGILLLVLVGILLAAVAGHCYTVLESDTQVTSQTMDPAEIDALTIDWAAGDIRILTGDVEEITFTENGAFDEDESFYVSVSDGCLKIAYSRPRISLTMGSLPRKDLTVVVPKDWYCRRLTLNAASVDIEAEDLRVGEMILSGASMELDFHGEVDTLKSSGASTEVSLRCENRPEKIDLSGASCEFSLTLPRGCGFRVHSSGLSSSFRCEEDWIAEDGFYSYGDAHCVINSSGVACEIEIQFAK